MISALAADIAGSDDPAQIAAHINGVTRDGEKCTTFADCIALVDAGDGHRLRRPCRSDDVRSGGRADGGELRHLLDATADDNGTIECDSDDEHTRTIHRP